jgi:hypothetical protein
VQNLIRVLHSGSGLEEIHLELQRLEKERDHLKTLMRDAEQKQVSDRDIQVLVEQIDELIAGFGRTLKIAPVHMQKNLIRQFVDHILVDRDNNHIVCYLKKVPSVDNTLLQKLCDLDGNHSLDSYHPIQFDAKGLRDGLKRAGKSIPRENRDNDHAPRKYQSLVAKEIKQV